MGIRTRVVFLKPQLSSPENTPKKLLTLTRSYDKRITLSYSTHRIMLWFQVTICKIIELTQENVS